MHLPSQQIIFTAAALACASVGSVHDVRERRIPNFITLPCIALGLTIHLAFGGWAGLAESAVAGLIAGALFFLFFLAGGMGAGDVKLMAAVGCLAGFAPLKSLVAATVLAGAVFALAVAIYNGRLRETIRNVISLLAHHREAGLMPHPELNLTNAATLRLPFALPIATGCLITLCTLVLEARP
jgi:prepilin peptidase CpaA